MLSIVFIFKTYFAPPPLPKEKYTIVFLYPLLLQILNKIPFFTQQVFVHNLVFISKFLQFDVKYDNLGPIMEGEWCV